MRVIGGLIAALALSLCVLGWAFWGWSETSAKLKATEATVQALDAERVRLVQDHAKQQERDGGRLDMMAKACASETDSGFDAGYRLGTARCGVTLP